jgi:hypothetical protein
MEDVKQDLIIRTLYLLLTEMASVEWWEPEIHHS